MKFPATIYTEQKETGLHIELEHFKSDIRRVYAENCIIVPLTDLIGFSCPSTFMLEPGDLFYLPSGEFVDFETNDCVCMMIYIPDSSLKGHAWQISLNTYSNRMAAAYQPVYECIREIITPPSNNDSFFEMHQKTMAETLIYLLLHNFSANYAISKSAKVSDLAPESFANLLRMLENNYTEEMKLTDLAKAYFYTSSHLSKLFVKYTGMSYLEYINELRLSKAVPLLISTTMGIGQISGLCGFSSERSFGQAFQKKYQMLPSVYRKNFYAVEKTQELPTLEVLKEAHNDGVFDAIMFFEVGQRTVQKELVYHDYGTHSLNSSANVKKISTNAVTHIIHLDSTKDLFLDEVQKQLSFLVTEHPFTHVVLNCFLADDMQVVFPDTLNRDFKIKKRIKRHVQYDFALYDPIFRFLERYQLSPIIGLSFMPSFLAKDTSLYNPIFHSCISMPCSMDEWNEYIFKLFNHLNSNFPLAMRGARVYIWNAPEIHLEGEGRPQKAEYFSLYENTYRQIKAAAPLVCVDSPTISITTEGIAFVKDFLQFTQKNDCLPEHLLFVHYQTAARGLKFQTSAQECKRFSVEVKKYLRSMHLKQEPLLSMFEYSIAFGKLTASNGLPGAMLPITMTLGQIDNYDEFGFCKGLAIITRSCQVDGQFNGFLSLMNTRGGVTTAFHSLRFLERLGTDCVSIGPGYCVCKTMDSIQMLFYYDIPRSEWRHPYEKECLDDFFDDFLDMDVTIRIKDFSGIGWTSEKFKCREIYFNRKVGNSFESWCDANWSPEEDEPVYNSFPYTASSVLNVEGDMLCYHSVIAPFEVRLVIITPG